MIDIAISAGVSALILSPTGLIIRDVYKRQGEETVRIFRPTGQWQNYCYQGENFKNGTVDVYKRQDGNYKKVMAKYANPVVLILDEWLLLKPTNSEQRDIFELLHRRRKKSSTIFCSQYAFEEWYEQLGGGDSPLADAIIDRIAHDSYRINITSIDTEHDRSMREVYGLDKELRE